LSFCALPAWREVAITVAPASLASRMVAVPMPPDAPVIRTLSFTRRFNRSATMRWAVAHGHMAAAPWSRSSAELILIQ
jgi:hypothetical protein